MIISELTEEPLTTEVWSVGSLATVFPCEKVKKRLYTEDGAGNGGDDDEHDDADSTTTQNEAAKAVAGDQTARLTKDEVDKMRYMGILEEYLRSSGSAAASSDEPTANEPQPACPDLAEERKRWKFRILFFVVYTLFTVINFVLVYNFFNYQALVLQVVNLSITYLLLLFGL